MPEVGDGRTRLCHTCAAMNAAHNPYLPPVPRKGSPKRDPEATRKMAGWILYGLLMAIGAVLLFLLFIVAPMLDPQADLALDYYTMGLGALFALPLLCVYMCIPWIVDRYDPEPLWALLTVLAWGAIAACGYSGIINTLVHGITAAALGPEAGGLVSACISAPLVEEGTKGFAVFWMFYFRKRDFDGVVDGIIYACFVALGFAAVENILYYGNAAKEGMTVGHEGAFATTVVLRGILAPWGHPLYTAMTGIGFGIARETHKSWLRWMAPIGGYFAACFLHFLWNFIASVSGKAFIVMLPLWILAVLLFFGLVVWLVFRKGRIIRDHLNDEVLLGHLTPGELALICSPVGRMKARMSFGGSAGVRFVDAAARLALSKWHTTRATQGRKMTVSADFIVPLRHELKELRGAVSRNLGRSVPEPRPWTPPAVGQQSYPQGHGGQPNRGPQPPPGGYGTRGPGYGRHGGGGSGGGSPR